MPKEQEYITIETTIRKTAFGTERTDKLVAKASKISETFKEELWENYSINVDDLKVDDLKVDDLKVDDLKVDDLKVDDLKDKAD